MFSKAKKTQVNFTYGLEGLSGSSRTLPLKDGELFEHLSELRKRHGKLIVEFTNDDTIHITSADSLKHERFEERIEDMTDMIRQYVKGQAIAMEAYAVFAKGELKGVFGQEVQSRLKKSSLYRDGFIDEDIEIKVIQVGSFENIT